MLTIANVIKSGRRATTGQHPKMALAGLYSSTTLPNPLARFEIARKRVKVAGNGHTHTAVGVWGVSVLENDGDLPVGRARPLPRLIHCAVMHGGARNAAVVSLIELRRNWQLTGERLSFVPTADSRLCARSAGPRRSNRRSKNTKATPDRE